MSVVCTDGLCFVDLNPMESAAAAAGSVYRARMQHNSETTNKMTVEQITAARKLVICSMSKLHRSSQEDEGEKARELLYKVL